MKDIAVDSEKVCLWFVDHSYDRAMDIGSGGQGGRGSPGFSNMVQIW